MVTRRTLTCAPPSLSLPGPPHRCSSRALTRSSASSSIRWAACALSPTTTPARRRRCLSCSQPSARVAEAAGARTCLSPTPVLCACTAARHRAPGLRDTRPCCAVFLSASAVFDFAEAKGEGSDQYTQRMSMARPLTPPQAEGAVVAAGAGAGAGSGGGSGVVRSRATTNGQGNDLTQRLLSTPTADDDPTGSPGVAPAPVTATKAD